MLKSLMFIFFLPLLSSCYFKYDTDWQYQARCNKGEGESCLILGYHADDDALRYYKRSCELGNVSGCGFYGINTQHQEDQKEARWAFTRSCELNESMGCYQLAEFEFEHGNKVKARQLMYQSCMMGMAFACKRQKALR